MFAKIFNLYQIKYVLLFITNGKIRFISSILDRESSTTFVLNTLTQALLLGFEKKPFHIPSIEN
jgi:hypothetical protein